MKKLVKKFRPSLFCKSHCWLISESTGIGESDVLTDNSKLSMKKIAADKTVQFIREKYNNN